MFTGIMAPTTSRQEANTEDEYITIQSKYNTIGTRFSSWELKGIVLCHPLKSVAYMTISGTIEKGNVQ